MQDLSINTDINNQDTNQFDSKESSNTNSSNNTKKFSFGDNQETHRVLLFATTFFSILSLISPLKTLSSLGMRGSSMISAGISQTNDDIVSQSLRIVRLASISFGIVGTVFSQPFFIIASLASDLALQCWEGGSAILKGEKSKALMHANVIVIDTLALASLAVGSWKIMLIASTVNCLSMFIMGSFVFEKDFKFTPEFLCYTILSLVNAVNAIKISEHKKLSMTLTIKNEDPKGHLVLMKDNQVIATSKPGQDLVINKPSTSSETFKVIHVLSNGEVRVESYKVPEIAIHSAMSAQEIPYIPVGGPANKAMENNLQHAFSNKAKDSSNS